MNTPTRRSLIATAAILLLATAMLPIQAEAPKGAQQLAGLSGALPARVAAGSPRLMSCTGCDSKATHVTTAARGQQIPAVAARHGCSSCSTDIAAVGHGKSKAQVARHSCTMASTGAAGCCGSASDAGMTR